MKDDSPPRDGKSPHERFAELGRRILSVPKAQIDREEKNWRKERTRKKRSRQNPRTHR